MDVINLYIMKTVIKIGIITLIVVYLLASFVLDSFISVFETEENRLTLILIFILTYAMVLFVYYIVKINNDEY